MGSRGREGEREGHAGVGMEGNARGGECKSGSGSEGPKHISTYDELSIYTVCRVHMHRNTA